MIKRFVEIWNKHKEELEEIYKKEHPEEYKDIVRNVVKLLNDNMDDEYPCIDPDRIHKIDDGDYQGTLLFIIGATGYQPSDYWSVFVDYGSCSGCDQLEGIRGYNEADLPTEQETKDYMSLSLHILQGLKKISNRGEE